MTLLSVCIPTWNGEAHLARTLASLLAQEDAELEVIVTDDASGDGTVDIARSFSDSRITVYEEKERLGLVPNWNRAIAPARGDYLVLMGQDDEVDPEWAKELIHLLDGCPQAGLAFCRRRFAFADEKSRHVMGDFFLHKYPAMLAEFYGNTQVEIPPDVMLREACRHNFEFNLIGEPTFVMFRRNHPAVAEGFDPTMAQMIDWEFWTRFFVDQPIVQSPRELGTYYLHAAGESLDNAQNIIRHWREYDYLLTRVMQRFTNHLDREQSHRLGLRQDEQRQRIREAEAGEL